MSNKGYETQGQMDFDNIKWFVQNNVSNAYMVKYSGNMDYNVHVIGASRLGEQTVFRDNYPGVMSQAVASIETERGDFRFPEPQRIEIPVKEGGRIKTLVIRFGLNTGQFATRLKIDGVEHMNNSIEFKLAGLQEKSTHVIEITHWNVQNYPVRIIYLGTDDACHIDYIRVGDHPSNLKQMPHMFSNWVTNNKLVDVAKPQRTLDMTLHRNNDLGYIPEITFTFNHLTPEQWRDASKAFNRPFFFIEYYDQELMLRVIRKMYISEMNTDRPLAFDWTYKGMIGNKFRVVSYLGFDARSPDESLADNPHAKLVQYATYDARWNFGYNIEKSNELEIRISEEDENG